MSRSGGASLKSRKQLQATDEWRSIEEQFLATGQAGSTQQALAERIDVLVAESYRAVIEPHFPLSVALLAGGAYGQGQIFPYSELDLLLILENGRRSDALNELLPEMVRQLWNAGLRVNSVVLTIAECVEALERAGVAGLHLLDRRLLAGDRAVHEMLGTRMSPALGLHREKLCQRLRELARARHARYQNTPDHAEPDVKESPGGWMDLRLTHLLETLKAEAPGSRGEVSRAAAFVVSTRCFLHYHAGCDHNILDFEAQASAGRQAFAAGKASRDWVDEYFQSARTIFNEVRRSIDGSEKSQSSLLENFREYRSRLSNQEFTVSRDRLLLRNPTQLVSDPATVFRMLEFIGRHGVVLAAETERKVEASRESFAAYCSQSQPLWAALKPTLNSPNAAMALRVLETTGLLRALLPEWGPVDHLVAPASTYRYTVGEHVLRTIEAVAGLGSLAHEERRNYPALLAEIDDVSLLLIALVFHEMGRDDGDPVGRAVQRARESMARIQMPDEARRTVEFLVRHQADILDAFGAHDLGNPETVRLLAQRAGTIERLRMLAVMTYSRIVAFSAEAELAARLEQLWQAYAVIKHELMRELETDRIQEVPEDLPANAEFIKGFPLRYLQAHTSAEVAEHLRLFELSRPTGVAVRLEPIGTAHRLTVVARDLPALFASFAGAISSFGLDIYKAEAFSNAAGILLDTFEFGDPRGMLERNSSEADRLCDLIRRIALGKTDAYGLMRGREVTETRKRAMPPQVQFDSEASAAVTLVEIETEDRPGLLYCLASVFAASACNIDVVLVDTKGHRAIDVFYVAHEGRKLSPDLQERLKEKLLAVC